MVFGTEGLEPLRLEGALISQVTQTIHTVIEGLAPEGTHLVSDDVQYTLFLARGQQGKRLTWNRRDAVDKIFIS